MKSIYFVLLYLVQKVLALHFYSVPGDTKCFYEQLAKDNLLLAHIDVYKETEDAQFVKSLALELSITIYETFSRDEIVFSQQNSPLGEFTFTAMRAGEHRICITPKLPEKAVRLRVFIDLSVSQVDVLDSKRLTDITYLKNRLVYLISTLEDIRAEQNIYKLHEDIFRDQSDIVNTKIMLWSLLEVIVMIGVCSFQLKYLRNFFIKQKAF
ncbi:Erp5p Ecym_5520 [Eremothecium cymbalariae DBVPG|uniref:GOLD domain-containing protein n=1 Tax=Eremothecium cymbalariae (strain CBS 270.75 / DBVPG 7215 / KCTC 17166 / NRRL Y-17582) TaxID=931890 RepID=I6NDW9_ERECY|nr:hypothetical protein Ecym_5520 [Eremothecium cymbalariae DBVPG\